MSSLFNLARHGYEDIVSGIIRPTRSQYPLSLLGPSVFEIEGREFQRTDFALLNQKSQRLYCSFWEPTAKSRTAALLPCVIYLHGNSSSRAEALMQLSQVLALGCCYVAFDCAGSGISDGEYVSLGAFEKEDLKVNKTY